MIEAIGPSCHNIRLEGGHDFEQWVMLTADRHFDSVQCDRDLMKQHLDLAVSRNAIIIDVGDWFDIMQGKYDPRKNYDNLREEYKGVNYLDLVLEDAEKFFAPYAENHALIAMGNHETELERRMGTNMIQRMVDRINKNGGNCYAGGYTGYIIFRFTMCNNKRSKIVLKYHHGMGGGSAPVTRGVIQSNRMAVMFPDADVVVSGHNHESWCIPIQQEKVSRVGKISLRPQWHVRVPSYKDGWGSTLTKGFDVEKGTPKPRGCVWLRFWCSNANKGKVDFELTQMAI